MSGHERRRGRFAPAARFLRTVASWALPAAGLGLAAMMIVPAAVGLQRYVITGDSMSGTYDRGSILYSQEVPVDELEVGDVITYEPPRSEGIDGLVTHRIVSIDNLRRGLVFRTKGDANAKADPWRFDLEGPTQARAEFDMPFVGYAFAALGIREVRMALIGLPALLIALALLVRLWRDAGEEARRRAEPAASGEGIRP
jgi:signal peptidase